MKRKTTYLVFILLLTASSMHAQVVDTTVRINTWKLMHNYSRFEDTEMDTTLFGLHRIYDPVYRVGSFYERTGTWGNAAQNLNFFQRPGTTDFLFGAALKAYMASPDNTIFFNTRSPYSEILYSTTLGVDGKEEGVRFLHTQNMDPFSNIGVEFELLSGKEYFIHEEARMTKISLFGNRTKNRYSAFGTFHYNSFNNNESGGIKSVEDFQNGIYENSYDYPVNLGTVSSGAVSGTRNLQLFYTQKYALQEKISTTDTMGVTHTSGRNISVNHQLQAERNKRFFSHTADPADSTSFYDNFYYLHAEVKDSVVYDRLANTLQLILGDPYTDRLSARVYAGHELGRYVQQSPKNTSYFSHYDTLSLAPLTLDSVYRDTILPDLYSKIFNEIFVGFHMAGPPENDWYWNIDGKYYLAGYYRNNFIANATFSRALTDSLRLGLRGGIENRNVSYFHNHYSSSFFQWNRDFDASQIIKGEAFLTNPAERFEASLSLGMLSNYHYWDENALPAHHDQLIYIANAVLKKRFKAGGFISVNELLLQYTTGSDVLRLPLAAARTSNYWEKGWFDNVLFTQVGFELSVTTPYLGYAYMPATGVFYLQNDQSVGGYPYLDAYLSARLKRARFFISYNNVLSGLISNNYFLLAGYPQKPRFIRLGLAWTFYD